MTVISQNSLMLSLYRIAGGEDGGQLLAGETQQFTPNGLLRRCTLQTQPKTYSILYKRDLR